MALKMAIETPSGIALAAAYIRIEQLGGTKENLHLTLGIYADQAAAESNKETLDQKFYYFNPSVSSAAANYHKQGYEFLKTLPEFEKAIDA